VCLVNILGGLVSALVKIGKFFLGILATFYLLFVTMMPIGGLVFFALMIVSGAVATLATFGTLGAYTPFALLILSLGWKFYLCVVVFVLAIMLTGTFQHCCVGLNTLNGHLRKHTSRHVENLLIALLWPLAIYRLDQNLRGWYMNWGGFALGTLDYWLFTAWEGVLLETLNIQTGETSKEYIKPDKKEQ
jgi:hypothetical protein